MISIDTAGMKIARRLNGTPINGYAGYYGEYKRDGEAFFIIAIPLNQPAVNDLMEEIDIRD